MSEIKFTSHKLYLFGFLFSRNTKKTRTDLKTLQVFFTFSKETTQTFKSSNCKKLLLHCACYRYNLLRWMFFISFDNWKSFFCFFFCKSLSLLWDSFSCHIAASVLKEVRILRNLHSVSAALIPKFQNKAIVYLINFLNGFCFVTVSHFSS